MERRRDLFAELRADLESSAWFMSLLADVALVAGEGFWIGGGAVRDLVWDRRFGAGEEGPVMVKDVDVVFHDLLDLERRREREVEARLSQLRPEVPWDVKNQAAVHLWYGTRFGVGAVSSLDSVAEAVATWPETATAVAVRHDAGRLVVVAPCGLGDLLNGVWRWNPGRATVADFCRRLAAKDVARRWPRVRVEVPSTTSAYAAAG